MHELYREIIRIASNDADETNIVNFFKKVKKPVVSFHLERDVIVNTLSRISVLLFLEQALNMLLAPSRDKCIFLLRRSLGQDLYFAEVKSVCE